VIGVVAGAPYSDLDTILRERARVMGFSGVHDAAIAEVEREGGFKVADASPLDAAPNVRVPVLLLHGTNDTFIDVSHSQKLLEKLPRARLIRLVGATHASVLQHAGGWDAIVAFVDALG
jgi:pimeloyl-ACP methyl ester carboxylesterase